MKNKPIPQNIKDEIYKYFSKEYSLAFLHEKFNLQKETITNILKKKFGKDAYAQWQEDNRKYKTEQHIKNPSWADLAKKLWDQDYSINQICTALRKVSSCTKRNIKKYFLQFYTEEEIQERGKRLKAKNQSPKKPGCTSHTMVGVNCFKCNKKLEITKGSYAKKYKENILCEDCKNEDKDRKCPVCDRLIKGKKGLASHFNLMFDEKHSSYLEITKYEEKKKKIEDAKKNRSESTKKAWKEGKYNKGNKTKIIKCPDCKQNDIEVKKYCSEDNLKRIKCNDCLKRDIEQKIKEQNSIKSDPSKKENIDYIECKICGFISLKSLAGHLIKKHNLSAEQYKTQFNIESIVIEPIRSKWGKERKERKVSDETKLKQSQNGGWSKGLTKETDERIKRISEGKKGKKTKSKPVAILKEELLKFKDSNDQILIKEATEELQLTDQTIRKYCNIYNLDYKKYYNLQTSLLKILSKILDGFPYEFNMTFNLLRNKDTGHKFIYDGYFGAPFNLLVEIDGYQHDIYPNYFHKTKEDFDKQQITDKRKKALAIKNGFNFLRIKFNEDHSEKALEKKLRQTLKQPLDILILKALKIYEDIEIDEKDLKENIRYKNVLESILKWVWQKKGFPLIEKNFNAKELNVLYNKEFKILTNSNSCLTFLNSYMPHMWDIITDNKKSAKKYFEENLEDLIKNRLKYSYRDGKFILNRSRMQIGLKLSTGVPKNFKPAIAKFLIEKYGIENTKVFDPCCGFGGRLLGSFAAKNCISYTGCEPSIKTYLALNELKYDLEQSNIRDNFKININSSPIEDYNTNEEYDLILTSPPYFDKEKYAHEETQSFLKYPDYLTWKNNFLLALAKKSYEVLKEGKYAIFMINNYKNYNLIEDFKLIMEEVGFKYIMAEINIQKSIITLKNCFNEPLLIFKK